MSIKDVGNGGSPQYPLFIFKSNFSQIIYMIILARVVYGFLFTTRQLVSDVRRARKVTYKTGFLLEEEMLSATVLLNG